MKTLFFKLFVISTRPYDYHVLPFLTNATDCKDLGITGYTFHETLASDLFFFEDYFWVKNLRDRSTPSGDIDDIRICNSIAEGILVFNLHFCKMN